VTRRRKIALIGAKGYSQQSTELQVSCFAWDELKKVVNLRDYDTVIINLLSTKGQRPIDWDKFADVLDISEMQDILRNGGAFIVLGDPRFEIELKNDSSEKVTDDFLFWTGIKFAWDGLPGDTIESKGGYEYRRYEEYLKHLKHWEYSLARCEMDEEKLFNLEYLKKEHIAPKLHRNSICRNRYGGALVFSLNIILEKTHNYRRYASDTETHLAFGPLIFLPEISLTEDETLVIILRDLCGVESSLPEPDWLESFNAPGQKVIDDKIRLLETEIDSLIENYQIAQSEREKARECLKLLYERGDQLEIVVRNILRGLGAHVEDPENPGKEDGWITVQVSGETLEGVLEVKSTRNPQFGEDGIRQLLDWVNRGVQLRQKKYKGLFWGNSSVDKVLNERPWPFSDNWTKSAELHELAAMTTSELYVIHLLNASGKLNVEEFWQSLFSCKGVFDMTSYLTMLAPKKTDS